MAEDRGRATAIAVVALVGASDLLVGGILAAIGLAKDNRVLLIVGGALAFAGLSAFVVAATMNARYRAGR